MKGDAAKAKAAYKDFLLLWKDTDLRWVPYLEACDLIERDLCWHSQIITHPSFVDFVREVKERFRTL